MSTISAANVQQHRQRTGAGLMDCKSALSEAAGDLDKAMEVLRKKGIMKASKKGSFFLKTNGRKRISYLGIFLSTLPTKDYSQAQHLTPCKSHFQTLWNASTRHIKVFNPKLSNKKKIKRIVNKKVKPVEMK